MTAPAMTPLILDEPSIACEWPEQCDRTASVMLKGCDDDRHYAVCAPHFRMTREWFHSLKPYPVCNACERPLMHFESHYDVVGI